LEAVYAAALGTRLDTVAQLRRRLGTPVPGRPTDDRARLDRLCRYAPALLWDSWALRLCPPSVYQRSARPALAPSLLLVHTDVSVAEAVRSLGEAGTRNGVVMLLWKLAQTEQWSDIRGALIRLADYLDTEGAPIDYRRRRSLDYRTLLPDTHWRTIARNNTTRPEGAGTARNFLSERICGSPVIPTPVPSYAYADYGALARFPVRLNPELLAAVDEYAMEFLASQGVTGEPVCWEPPTELINDLRLPGLDVDTVDMAELHRMVRYEQLDLRAAATRIGISADAARVALQRHPAHRDPKPASIPRPGPHRPGPAYLHATRTLPPQRFRDLYEHQHHSLRQLAAIAGVSKATITELAHDYAIPLREAHSQPRHVIDPDWLYTEHVTNGRSLSDIARGLGISVATISTQARKYRNPVRGPRWYTAQALRANANVPPLLISALVGQGGWERLQHFVTIAQYPNYRLAAEALNLPTTTPGHQIGILECDLGKPLVEPGTDRKPLTITPFGRRVIAAVEQLAAAGGP
jgi:hypothetical protein